jgi:hypothetical protein
MNRPATYQFQISYEHGNDTYIQIREYSRISAWYKLVGELPPMVVGVKLIGINGRSIYV